MHLEKFTAFSPEDLCDQIREHAGNFTPSLLFIFSSPALDINECLCSLKDSGYRVFGSSTAGEILTGQSKPPVIEQSAVCCMLDPDPAIFSVRVFQRGDLSSFELGKDAGSWCAGCFARPAALMIVAGLANDSEAIIRGMEVNLPKGSVIAGGVAADDNAFETTAAFSQSELTKDGIVILAMDTDRVSLSNFTTSGWTGVGVEMLVDSSDGNIVCKIDGRKPIDVVSEYLNIKKDDVISTALSFPMLVRRADGSTVLRTALSADQETGALIYAGGVPEGSKIRFSSSFGFETIEQTIRELTAYHAENPDADLIILFDCCARHQAAGEQIDEEINAISYLWGVPVIGFFTYGEIGQNASGCYDVFNETLSLAILKFK